MRVFDAKKYLMIDRPRNRLQRIKSVVNLNSYRQDNCAIPVQPKRSSNFHKPIDRYLTALSGADQCNHHFREIYQSFLYQSGIPDSLKADVEIFVLFLFSRCFKVCHKGRYVIQNDRRANFERNLHGDRVI